MKLFLLKVKKKLAGEKLFGIKVAKETVESGFSLKNGKIILNNEFSSLIPNSFSPASFFSYYTLRTL